MSRKVRSFEERFWEKVNKTAYCWEWTGHKMNTGYGFFGREFAGSHSQLVHRWAWELAYGKAAPKGVHVLHKCDNRACVRPDHLFLGTDSDNMQDMHTKGRHPNGLKTHCPYGHEYVLENILWTTWNGKRRRACRKCNNIRNNVRYHRLKAMA